MRAAEKSAPMVLTRAAFGIAIGIALAACSTPQQPPSATAQIAEDETRQMRPIVDRYKSQSVMGFDIKGTTLVLSVDAEGWSQLDESADIALRNAILDAWARVWAKHHPRQRAALRLRVQNYYGQEITSQTKPV